MDHVIAFLCAQFLGLMKHLRAFPQAYLLLLCVDFFPESIMEVSPAKGAPWAPPS